MYNHYPKCGLKPVSPGEILFEEFLRPLEITQKELAEHIHCDYKVINRIVNDKARVTPDIALRLASAFETTPVFWLNAQTAVDLWQSKSRKHKIPSLIKKKKPNLC
ncbi:MAG: HigA family addiction module antidote protein [Chlamydiia bacterium]|nr:HigA family addiction module antidote protein [Chlamydiia bacterium]MCP5508812.1 HigA family addiction module antidote protein [Chlamydiales bacterium]HPE85442.1 HigA family addiction module antitoxin [Chlamydiales bacterium]